MVTLDELSRAHGWLTQLRPLPEPVLLELSHRFEVDLTYHSTAIEGNTLTKSETQIVIEKGITIAGKPLLDHLEVVGHKEALELVIELSKERSPLTEWDLRSLHSVVMKGQSHQESGAWRRLDVKAAGTDYNYPSYLQVPDLMKEFIEWLSVGSSLHPICFASEAHLRFVTIHPFQDGNGRVGRLLLNLLLLRAGYPIAVIQLQNRPRYIASLESAQNGRGRDDLDLLIFESLKASFEETFRTTLSFQDLKINDSLRSEILDWIG